MSARHDNPWYAETFLAIGGWIAGLLAAGAIFAFVGTIFTSVAGDKGAAATALGIGLGFVLFGGWFGKSGVGDFRRHFAISTIAAGLTAATLGCGYLIWSALDSGAKDVIGADQRKAAWSGLATAVLFVPVAALAARTVKDGILTFLTTSAWFWIVGASLMIGSDDQAFGATPLQVFPPAAALLGLALFTGIPQRLPAVGAALLIAPMIFYATLQGGIGLIGVEALHTHLANKFLYAAGAAFCLILLRDRYPLLGLLGGTGLIAAGVWFLPDSGGIAILILLAGMAAGHRGFAAVGVAALAWFIGKFYYDLSMTLLQKSAVMGGLGAATLAGALLARRLQTAPAVSPALKERRSLLAVLAFGALLAGSLALTNRSAMKIEAEFAEARTIYLPLGPVDPRSILQGDYMFLAFRETIYPPFEMIEKLPERGEVFLKLDADGVASFSRIAGSGDAPATDEIRVDYLKSGGSLRYCPNTFFFQEGEGEIFNAARFAVVKVAADGKTRLIALADENRKIVGPTRGD